MNISVNWLRELIPGLDDPPETLAERLTMRAVAVDAVVPVGEGLTGVRVGRVLAVERHPDADRLWLCRVESGGDAVDVVCGAPVVEEGALYPYVPPGVTLPGGLRIESREIRGVTSHGMLCSEHELGLGRDRSGIMKLPPQLEVGSALPDVYGLPDSVLLLDLTPNRVDLACHVGVARELAGEGVAGILLRKTGGPGWTPTWRDDGEEASVAGIPVRIEDPDRCSRYLGAVIRGVRVGPSPPWLAGRLRAVGLRPVNNVVDATNYVLLELNQPIHAFDLGKLRGPAIGVRPARAGETLRTLDGEARELGPEATVIVDGSGPVALAGVMGGEESEVAGRTRDLFIECAAFDPRAVRRTSKTLGLSTDASYRFERGIDESALEAALTRCVELILSVAGGAADAEAARVGVPAPPPAEVPLRGERVRRVLGIDPDEFTLRRLLEPLGFEVLGDGGRPFRVRVPGWRRDVTREVDLIEEVARRHGYEEVPRAPRWIRPTSVPEDPAWERADRTRRLLAARGLLEVRSSPFSPREQPGGDADVALLNPLSAEEGYLRAALVPHLLRRMEHNFARGRRDVRLFEIGTVFRLAGGGPVPGTAPRGGAGDGRGPGAGAGATGGDGAGGAAPAAESDAPPDVSGAPADAGAVLPRDRAVTRETYSAVLSRFEEEIRVGAVLTGRAAPVHWSGEGRDLDLWDIKGLAAEVAEELCGGRLEAFPTAVAASAGAAPGAAGGGEAPPGTPDWLEAEAFRILRDGETLGVCGPIRQGAVDAPPWAGPVWGLEFRLQGVLLREPPAYRPLSPYPVVRRDLAVTVPVDLTAAEVEAGIRETAPPLLESVELFDVYEGGGIEAGRRSLAWAFRFRSPDRTLTDEEVDAAMDRIVSELEEACDARVRSS